MKIQKTVTDPKGIAEEYAAGKRFKEGLGENGIYEQSKINERFFVGDQWYGVQCGNSRPLARRNIIKRIGEYKMASVGAASVAVNYSADGVPDTVDIKRNADDLRESFFGGTKPDGVPDETEISVITSALSDYFRTTAERVKLENKKEQILRNAYISGMGILFTYWDDTVKTGLYADKNRNFPIKGDIAAEVLEVENVNFGDPNCQDVQKQPYIIISQRRDVDDVKREAHKNRMPTDSIAPDSDNSGSYGEYGSETYESRRVTVYTKLYKEWSEDGGDYRVMAVRVTENAVIRKPWCLNLRNYPISVFCWERRRGSAYGESEITYLIPNQIAVNRALTASVWAVMSAGMPKTVVNGDIVSENVTNDPGQVIKVYGTAEDVAGAVRYITPPNFSSQLINVIDSIAVNTMSDSGANDAALGNFSPDNAAAIIQLREAAKAPMQIYTNRFYDFIEDTARIWADFWINMYGDRSLKIKDKNGTRYMPFYADRYRNLVISAKIDVGAASVWSDAVIVSSLDNLLSMGLISFDQYLARLPGGMIPDVTGLREELKAGNAAGLGEGVSDEELISELKRSYPSEYDILMSMDEEERGEYISSAKSTVNGGTTEREADAI